MECALAKAEFTWSSESLIEAAANTRMPLSWPLAVPERATATAAAIRTEQMRFNMRGSSIDRSRLKPECALWLPSPARGRDREGCFGEATAPEASFRAGRARLRRAVGRNREIRAFA